MTAPLGSSLCRGVIALLSALALTVGCTPDEPAPNTLIVFLFSSVRPDRAVGQDEALLSAQVKARCPECDYVSRDAAGSGPTQRTQATEALADGADVLIIDAVTEEVGEEIVATSPGVPVIAYERYVAGADYFVGVDPARTARQLTRAILTQVDGSGPARVMVVHDPPANDEAAAARRAVRSVLATKKAVVVAEFQPDSVEAADPSGWLRRQLRTHPPRTIGAIITPSDRQAGVVAGVFRAAKVPIADRPLIAGRFAELDGVRRLVLGTQEVTIDEPLAELARTSAEVAVRLVTDTEVEGAEEYQGIASFLYEGRVVTLDTLTDVLVREGRYSLEEICAGQTRRRCIELGLI